jgi:hypothetical protein
MESLNWIGFAQDRKPGSGQWVAILNTVMIFGVHKIQGNAGVAAQLTNSEEQLNYMELIFRQTNRIIK